MTYEEALALPPDRVRTMATNPAFVRLRRRWYVAFGGHRPRTEDVQNFWRRFVLESSVRPGHLLDGWLTDVDYGDA